MKSHPTNSKVSWLRVAYMLLAALFILIIVDQIASLKGSIYSLRHCNLGDAALVFMFVLTTFFFGALTYCLLALKRLKYFRTVVAEIGINTLNKLLPVGIAAIGANYVYLNKARHTKVQAAAIVAINNSMGVIGNGLILIGVLLFAGTEPIQVHHINSRLLIVCLIILSLAAGVFYLMPGVTKKIKLFFKNFFAQIGSYRHRKAKLLLALLSSCCLTLASTTALYFSLEAVGGHLPLSSIIVVFSFGIFLGAIIPAPGGVGSVDAGLVGALVAYNVNLTEAVACVLLFRLISFWIPFIGGAPALVWIRRRGYI